MTDTKPNHRRGNHWDEWNNTETNADDLGDIDDSETVYERLIDEVDPDELHGILLNRRKSPDEPVYYLIVAQSTRQFGGPVLDLRTVIVDLEADTVKVGDNGLWVPRESDVLDGLTRLVARSTTDVSSADKDREPLMLSGSDESIDSVLSEPIATDDYEPQSGYGVDWGNGQGPPPEVHQLDERLREAGVRTDRYSRLDFGSKSPWERYADRPADELLGNYGVETLEGDDLIVVDVDDPDDAPLEELPKTYSVSSPHGDDRRAHHFYVVEDSELVTQHFGSSAVKPGWGDVWVSGEYVVGPGCVLDGCDKEGCQTCADRDGGRYDVLSDVPIAEMTSDDLIDLLEDSWCHESPNTDDEPDDRDLDIDDDDQDDEVETTECYDCGLDVEITDATLVDRDGSPAYVCGGDCDD